jgi:hypothetical protein
MGRWGVKRRVLSPKGQSAGTIPYMSVIIPFPPEIEAKLRESAAAAGKDVGTFVREAVEEKLGLGAPAQKSPDEWSAEFGAWMRDVATRASAYPEGFVVDDSRQSIYEGRGE